MTRLGRLGPRRLEQVPRPPAGRGGGRQNGAHPAHGEDEVAGVETENTRDNMQRVVSLFMKRIFKLDRGSISSSLRDNLSTPYRLTKIKNIVGLLHVFQCCKIIISSQSSKRT